MTLDSFFEERLEVGRSLADSGELSLLNTFNTDLPRIFVVAAASHFEAAISDHLLDFFAEASDNNETVAAFMSRRALFRNYHSLFDWSATSANKFFSTFGAPCLEHYKRLARDHDWLLPSALAFLQLGDARNLLVHGNFALHSPTLTADDVRVRYAEAARFVDAIPHILRLQELT